MAGAPVFGEKIDLEKHWLVKTLTWKNWLVKTLTCKNWLGKPLTCKNWLGKTLTWKHWLGKTLTSKNWLGKMFLPFIFFYSRSILYDVSYYYHVNLFTKSIFLPSQYFYQLSSQMVTNYWKMFIQSIFSEKQVLQFLSTLFITYKKVDSFIQSMIFFIKVQNCIRKLSQLQFTIFYIYILYIPKK